MNFSFATDGLAYRLLQNASIPAQGSDSHLIFVGTGLPPGGFRPFGGATGGLPPRASLAFRERHRSGPARRGFVLCAKVWQVMPLVPFVGFNIEPAWATQ